MCFRVDSVLFGRRCCCCCCCQMGRQLGFIRRNFLGRKERKTGDERAARKARTCVHCGIAEFLRPRVFSWDTSISLSLSTLHSLSSTRKEHVSLSFSLYSSTFLSFSLHSDDIHLFSSFLSERKIKIKHFLLFSLTRFWAVCCCCFFFFYIHVIRKVDLYAERKSSVSPSSFLSVCNNGQHTRLVCVCVSSLGQQQEDLVIILDSRSAANGQWQTEVEKGGTRFYQRRVSSSVFLLFTIIQTNGMNNYSCCCYDCETLKKSIISCRDAIVGNLLVEALHTARKRLSRGVPLTWVPHMYYTADDGFTSSGDV